MLAWRSPRSAAAGRRCRCAARPRRRWSTTPPKMTPSSSARLSSAGPSPLHKRRAAPPPHRGHSQHPQAGAAAGDAAAIPAGVVLPSLRAQHCRGAQPGRGPAGPGGDDVRQQQRDRDGRAAPAAGRRWPGRRPRVASAKTAQAQRPAITPSGIPASSAAAASALACQATMPVQLRPSAAEGLEHRQVAAPPPHAGQQHVGQGADREQRQRRAEQERRVADRGVVRISPGRWPAVTVQALNGRTLVGT